MCYCIREFEYLVIMSIIFCPVQETNVLGFKGPRKMSVLVPAIASDSKHRISIKPKSVSIAWFCTGSVLSLFNSIFNRNQKQY